MADPETTLSLLSDTRIDTQLLCCKMLRIRHGKLQQLLHYQRSYPLPDGRVKVEVYDKWEEVENADLRLLHLGGTTKYSYIDWENLDWTKQDSVLGRELGLLSTIVRGYRLKLGKPRALRHGKNSTTTRRIFAPETLTPEDWQNNRDTDLAKKYKVTRERVRQLREVLKAPPCRFYRRSRASIDVLLWLEKHRDALAGKRAIEIYKQSPSTFSQSVFYALPRDSGIPFKTGGKFARPLDDVDWSLPDTILGEIWNIPKSKMGTYRYRLRKPSPKWSLLGIVPVQQQPALKEAIAKETANARQHGYAVNDDAVMRLLDWYQRHPHIKNGNSAKNLIAMAVDKMVGQFTSRMVEKALDYTVSYNTIILELSKLVRTKIKIVQERSGRTPMIYQKLPAAGPAPTPPALEPITAVNPQTLPPASDTQQNSCTPTQAGV